MNNLREHFNALTTLLLQTQTYWRSVAFHHAELPWMAQHPTLVTRLLALSLAQTEKLASDASTLLTFFENEISGATKLATLSNLPVLVHNPLATVNPRFYAGMPGRKWQQIQAFAACCTDSPLPILEWCAGKSYLGFYLQHLQQNKVNALEWDADLVQQANSRAKHSDSNLHSHQVDVLSADVLTHIQPLQQVVALHACGELHERLLKLCVAQKVQQLHLAPCCYHKRQDELYQPLSHQGEKLNLALNKTELHTAVMETVTAGANVQRQRKHLQIMRLGFDCLQRDITGNQQFLDLPSLPAKWARADFKDFCFHCADLKNITLPLDINWQHYQQLGEQRFKQVSALDLVRFLFRRPLEVWLALDRALLLQEQGYSVQLGTFCPSHVTPRNILIQAYLP
ncbi:methyltransferase [Paraglaciecola hydrolytica]|nr:methyltransferase [Paraglaciecola hydrolytica]